jgi:hypothetical protein
VDWERSHWNKVRAVVWILAGPLVCAVVGFALCSVATLFLPSRSAVRAHAEREKALASA